jgi:5-methylcytosine-specific restriction endonuclease McrA
MEEVRVKETYYQRNKKAIKQKQKEYYTKTREVQLAKNKIRNKEKYEQYESKRKEWRTNNIEQRRIQRAEYMREYRTKSADYRLKDNISHYIRKVLNGGKSGSYKKYLGCDIKDYKLYLEHRFTDKMNWDNYATYWEIDHIIPTSKNGSFHFSNTQPLTIAENRSKGNR